MTAQEMPEPFCKKASPKTLQQILDEHSIVVHKDHIPSIIIEWITIKRNELSSKLMEICRNGSISMTTSNLICLISDRLSLYDELLGELEK